MADSILTPYVVGPAIKDGQAFFGRQDLLDKVQLELRKGATNTLVLFGQRRIGKTSLLHQLAQTLPSKLFRAVYIDLQPHARAPLHVILADVAYTVAAALGMPEPDESKFESDSRYFDRVFLPSVYSILPKGVTLVLLFDEFDVLHHFHIDAPVDSDTSRDFFEYLGTLMADQRRLRFVLVLGRNPQDFRLDVGVVFKASKREQVWVLDRDSSERLIRQAEKLGVLRFDDESIEKVYEWTLGHPFLTQLICDQLWDRASSERPLQITPQIIDAVVDSAIDASESAFDWWWDGLTPAERIYSAAIAELTEDQPYITDEAVLEVLAAHAKRLVTREVEVAPRDLVERHVLVDVGSGGYRYSIPMFRLWVRKKKTLLKVKEELDSIDKIADQYYRLGAEFAADGDYAKAKVNFHSALERYPRHLKAQVGLGNALLQLGEVDDAVEYLEEAYSQDRTEAKWSLIRALDAKAAQFVSELEREQAVEVYDRILQLSPNERQAQEQRRGLLVALGDAAREKGQNAEARKLYLRADDDGRIAELDRLEREQLLRTLMTRVGELIAAENWLDAKEVADQIAAVDQENESATRLARAIEEEIVLQELYAEALGYISQNDARNAQGVLVSIIAKRADYKDVSRLLGEVNQRLRQSGIGKPTERFLKELQESYATPESTSSPGVSSREEPNTIAGQKVFVLRILVTLLAILAVILLLVLLWWVLPNVASFVESLPDLPNVGATVVADVAPTATTFSEGDAQPAPSPTPSPIANFPPPDTPEVQPTALPTALPTAIISRLVSESLGSSYSLVSMLGSVAPSAASSLIQPETNLQLEPGTHTLAGVPVRFDWAVSTQNRDKVDNPESILVRVNKSLSTHVAVLIQAGWATQQYMNRQIGTIRLHFDDGSAFDTPLILGENIRDWTRTNDPTAVITVTSPMVVEAWTGNALGRNGGMDLLHIPIPSKFRLLALTGVEIIDTSQQTVGSVDPSLYVLGVTLFSDWRTDLANASTGANTSVHSIEPGETMVVAGKSFSWEGYSCAGADDRICAVMYTASQPLSITVTPAQSNGLWVGITDQYTNSQVLSAVQRGFWSYPSCGGGCAFADVTTIQDGKSTTITQLSAPIIESSPDIGTAVSDAQSYIDRAKDLFGQEDYLAALADVSHAVNLLPNDPIPLTMRGAIYIMSGDNDAAITDLSGSLALSFEQPNVLLLRGAAYYQKAAYASAISDYNMALALAPDSALIYHFRGSAYSSIGDNQSAYSDFTQAIELDPMYADAYRSRAYVAKAINDLEQAQKDLEMYLQLAPSAADRSEIERELAQLGTSVQGDVPIEAEINPIEPTDLVQLLP